MGSTRVRQRSESDHNNRWFIAIESTKQIIRTVIDKSAFWQQHQNAALNTRQRKVINQLLAEGYGDFEGGMNTRKFASLCGVSKATAQRDYPPISASTNLKKP